MIIAIAGPYSADTTEQRQKNFETLNEVAARLLDLGHIPVIGVNAALPVVDRIKSSDRRKAIMDISLAVVTCADAILMFRESPGAIEEMELMRSLGKTVYLNESEIPAP